jgi:hypothetical protein
MRTNRIVALGLAAVVLAGGVVAAEKGSGVTSGPQVGQKVPGPFHPLNVTGKAAGEKHCLYCENGTNPVAMIFAREVSPELATLVKKVDAATAQHGDCSMGSFVVFLNDDETLKGKLERMAKEADLKKTVLSIDNPAGPKGYNVSKDADVTVVLYTEHLVKANHAFKKGELKEGNIDTIVGDISKILPQK